MSRTSAQSSVAGISHAPGARETVKAEVQGVSGDRPSVFLTANKLDAAKHHKEWTLAVVTRV